MHHAKLLLLAGLSGSLLPAQGIVLPPGAAAAEQDGRFALGPNLPLSPVPGRWIQIGYDQAELALAPPQTWSATELRPDAAGLAGPSVVRIALWLSAVAAPSPRGMSFVDRSANQGTDRVQVVRPRLVSLPAVAARANGQPQPGISLTFDTPYRWPGSSNLTVEIEWVPVSPWQPGTGVFDAQRYAPGDWAIDQRQVGRGCVRVGELGFTASTSRRDQDLLLTTEFSGIGVDPTASVLFGYAGSRVQIGLDPFGAPGCVLGIVPAITAVPMLFSTPTGAAFWTTHAVPYDPAIVGARIPAQAWIVRPGLNALGLATSATVEFSVTRAPSPRRAQVLVFDAAGGPATSWNHDTIPVLAFR